MGKHIFAAIWTILLLAVSCEKERGKESGPAERPEEGDCLVLNLMLPGDEPQTKASSAWIQDIVIGNWFISFYETGKLDQAPAFTKIACPLKKVSPNQPYQIACSLSGLPDLTKRYNIVIGVNIYDKNNMIEKSAGSPGCTKASWNELTKQSQVIPSLVRPSDIFNTSRHFQLSQGSIYVNGADASTVTINNPDGTTTENVQVFPWTFPVMSGRRENVRFAHGLNVMGFTVDNDGAFLNEIDYEMVNATCNSNYTTESGVYDVDYAAGSNSSRVMALTPRFAQILVDSFTNDSGGKFTLKDIFLMNVPVRHMIIADGTYHFGNTKKLVDHPKKIEVSTSNDLYSGFLSEWFGKEIKESNPKEYEDTFGFQEKTRDDDFIRLFHYPNDANTFEVPTVQVSQELFKEYYMRQNTLYRYETYCGRAAKNKYRFGALCVTNPSFGTNWNEALSFRTDNYNHLENVPFFLVSENDGQYENTTVTTAAGVSFRPYYFATRLVLRGDWKEDEDSESEVVYYPILVNSRQSGLEFSEDTDPEERNTFVRAGRRYIYDITVQNKGVYNPWSAEAADVKVNLKIKDWTESGVVIDRYIY